MIDIDDVLNDLTIKVRNNTVDGAAQVAALYGANREVIDAILRLKNIQNAASPISSTHHRTLEGRKP